MILVKNRANDSVKKEEIGRWLLGLLDEKYLDCDDSYIYRFMNQKRKLSKKVKRKNLKLETLTKDFQELLEDYLCQDQQKIVDDMNKLITDATNLSENQKQELKDSPNKEDIPKFLAKLFIYTVKNTENKPKVEYSLKEKIKKASSGVTLEKLAKEAMKNEDIENFNLALGKIDNHIYRLNTLVALLENKGLMNKPEFEKSFHNHFSRFTNNKYRYRMFEKYFEIDKDEQEREKFVELHLGEFTNDRYSFSVKS